MIVFVVNYVPFYSWSDTNMDVMYIYNFGTQNLVPNFSCHVKFLVLQMTQFTLQESFTV